MALATILSGACMTLVHSFAAQPLGQEYVTFGTLLRVLLLLAIPSAGLQIAFAQQTAAAEPGQIGALASLARRVLASLTLGWLGLVVLAFIWRAELVAGLKLPSPALLWPALGAAWASLALPVFRGLVQGRQNFAALGGSAILDGALRLTLVLALVVRGGGKAAAALTAAVIAMLVATGVTAWASRHLWLAPGTGCAWRPFARQVLPFTLAAACLLVLSQSDVIFLQTALPGAAAGADDLFQLGTTYLPAATIGFAMTQFTVPLAVVMFPKIARSFARSEPSDALRLALIGTALIGALAALAATVLPKLPLQILYFRSPANWAAWPMVPWCAWAMLSFALANVLVNDRLARADFRFVPWAVLLTLGFIGALMGLKPQLAGWAPFTAYRVVVGTIGGFNLALLALVAAVSARPVRAVPRAAA